MSKIEEIRSYLEIYKGSNRDLKCELIQWLTGVPQQRYHIALTLQPTKLVHKYKSPRHGFKSPLAYRCKGRNHVLKNGRDFVKILNKLVYANAYKRYGKRLDVVMVLEGEKSNTDPHLHFAIQVPSERDVKNIAKNIEDAIRMSGEFQIESPLYKATHTHDPSQKKSKNKITPINDEGWIEYITKELGPDSNEEINLEFPV